MRFVRLSVLIAAALAAPACFSPVDPPGRGADAGANMPGNDAGTGECAKDSDCPTPPTNLCTPVAGWCDRGTCRVKSLPTVWQNDPGACELKEHCACQELDGPECTGEWECVARRCSFKCSGPTCARDLECPSGQNCFADCQGVKTCQAGCHDASDCSSGKVCDLPVQNCGDPVGACVDASECTADEQCPLGAVCDYPDTYDGGGRHCLAGCHRDAQCALDERCVLTTCYNCPDCPCYGQCQRHAVCGYDTECPSGLVCGTEYGNCDDHCRPGCHRDADCRPNQACAPPPPCAGCGCDTGTCYDKPVTCVSDVECGTGSVCAPVNDPFGCTGEKQCVSGCFDDGDCAAGQACARAQCGACCPGTCEFVQTACTSDAACGPGEICEGCGTSGGKTCMRGCRYDAQCKANETCQPVDCDGCPCPAQCAPKPAGCQSDAECGAGMVCEPGPGCTGANECVVGCHLDSQCPNGGACYFSDSCLTCPCPGQCSTSVCLYNEPACSTGLQCQWGAESCTGGCCQQCPVLSPPACLPTQCSSPGGRDVSGCELGPTCGACCKCGPGTPVCGENYGTYGSECEASCAGVQVLHQGACLPYEGLGCDWTGGGCSAGQYCRDPCPMCGSVQQLRCTQIGACVYDWDCPGGLAAPSCANGNPPKWTCSNHACLASCP
ncbi:MAG: hypothetical protein QM765_13210 [Myxococcales bacterium]